METPVRKRQGFDPLDAQLGPWSQSPLVFTSPGGNVSTRGKSSALRKPENPQELAADENQAPRITSVSIPNTQLMPPPRLRSSFSSQVTPLRASSKSNSMFPFTPGTPLTEVKKTPSNKFQRWPPTTGKKKLRPKTSAELKAIESKERELRAEIFLRKQEKLYVRWLNSILVDAPRSASVFVPRGFGVVESHETGREPECRGLKKSLAAVTGDPGGLHALFNVTKLRQRLSLHFDEVGQDEILSVMVQVSKRVDDGRLRMKHGCAVLADVGLKKQAMSVVMSYTPAWLEFGLYIVLGLELSDETEDSVLENTLEKQFFTHSGIAKEYSTNRTVEGLYRDGYLEALGRVILKRLLLLVLVLDKVKSQTALQDDSGIDGLDGGSLILFRRSSAVKSSRQALQDILKNAMHGEGDVIAHLSTHGYRLSHAQSLLAEYDFETCSFEDLKDGVTLCRLAQVLANDASVLKRMHLPSNTKKRVRNHFEAALEAFTRAGASLIDEQGYCITADSILNGDRCIILSLLWNVFLHFQMPRLIHKEKLLQEVLRVEKMNDKVSLVESPVVLSDLLLRWTKAVCRSYNYEVEGFNSSFRDGQALCYLISFYMPAALPREKVLKNDSLENFGLLHDITSKLGFIDEVLDRCNFMEEEHVWRERNILLLVGLLCSNLVCGNLEALEDKLVGWSLEENLNMEASATRIQAHWRGLIQRSSFEKTRASATKIQSSWRRLQKRRETTGRMRAAGIIQKFYKGFRERCSFQEMVSSSVKIQAAWRGFFTRKFYSSAKSSVRRIQGWWQASLQRKKFRELRAGALVLQAYHRGRAQRIRFRETLAGARKIQAAWRGFAARKAFLLRKTSALRIQRRWRCFSSSRASSATRIQAFWRGYSSRRLFSEMKAAAIIVQKHFRGFSRRKSFKRCRRSVVMLQAMVRRMILHRRDLQAKQLLEKQNAAAVIVQSYFRSFVARETFTRYRRSFRKKLSEKRLLENNSARRIQAVFRGHSSRLVLKKENSAAVAVQRHYRGFIARRNFTVYRRSIIIVQALIRRRLVRRRFLRVKAAARYVEIVLEQRLALEEAQRLEMAAEKIQLAWSNYCYTKKLLESNSARRIQAAFRGHSARIVLAKQNAAVVVVQRHYRGFIARRTFTGYRRSIIIVQALIRRRLARRRYQRVKAAARYVEIVLEQRQALEEAQKMELAAEKIQTIWSSYWYMKKSASAMRIQAAFRGWRERRAFASRSQDLQTHSLPQFNVEERALEIRKLAATVMQSCYRGWRARVFLKSLRRSACLIQAYWRGFTTRRGQEEELMNLRLRMENTAATADCNMTLGNRLNEALAQLLSFKTVSSILHICATIDLATQHSRYCCERIAEGGAIVKILQLIQSTNRSTPHEQVLKHAISILRNLARFPLLARSILHTKACLCVVAEQLQVHRNNEEIFSKALEVIQSVSREFPDEVLRISPLVLRRLEHVKQLVEKKVESERRNVERHPPGSRVSSEKKLAEAKLQLSKVVSTIKTLTRGAISNEKQKSSRLPATSTRRAQAPKLMKTRFASKDLKRTSKVCNNR